MAGGHELKECIFRRIHSEIFLQYLKVHGLVSVVNPPTLPRGECSFHYLHVSQLKCFCITRENKKRNACRHFMLISLFPTFYVCWVSAIAFSNVFLIDDDLLIKLNESESLQFTVMAVQSIFETDF